MNSRALVCGFICVAIFAVLAPVTAAQPTAEDRLLKAVSCIDSSIRAMNFGKTEDAKAALTNARTHYENLRLEVGAAELDFTAMLAEPTVEGLKDLRADVLSAAGAAGVWLSPLYQHPALIIASMSAILALFVTLLSKRIVNWPRLKAAREEFRALGKEMLAARSRGDMKHVYKLQPRYRQLSGEVMGASLKQMFIPLIFYFVAWSVLGAIYAGWVVVWLPFGPATWPLFGDVVSAGFFYWFILTYFGFSVVWRQFLLGEW